MGRIIIANAFSLSMLRQYDNIYLHVQELSQELFCRYVEQATLSAVGHQATVQLINIICNTNISMNRVDIVLSIGDILVVIQVMERLPEGRVLTLDEIRSLMNQGRIRFYIVTLEDPESFRITA